jgi:glucose/arabinose dehydrogenase
MGQIRGVLIVALVGCSMQSLASAVTLPPPVNYPAGVNPASVRVTTFAEGLNFPTGMVQLSDGSVLVATTNTTAPGRSFYDAANVGGLVRLVDANNDGAADGPGTNLAPAGLVGSITSLAQAGPLLFVNHASNAGHQISVLRQGVTPSTPYTSLGTINLNYTNASAEHKTYELETRSTPGQPGSYDLFFNIGSELNNANASSPVNLGGLTNASGLLPESIYKLTVTDNGSSLSFGAPQQIASGLRNASGIAIQPSTGDLWFEDNGIDSNVNDQFGNVAFSADELNKIAAAQIGGAVENFGFANNYVRSSDGAVIGTPSHQAAFLPVNGHESEGANQIAFSPSSFPAGLNNGVFVGFHGQFNAGGTNNDENALVYYDMGTGARTHIIFAGTPTIGHPDGLLSTSNSLFVADLAKNGTLFGVPTGPGTGVIYQFYAVPEPSAICLALSAAVGLAMICRSRSRR